MRRFNREYEVVGTNVWYDTVNQVWLHVPIRDRAFQREYERALPGCSTQAIYGKDL